MAEESLADLVDAYVVRAGGDPSKLLAALGFRNPRKGAEFLTRIRLDDVRNAIHHKRDLALALDLPRAHIDAAITESSRRWHDALDARWRAAFKPHAVLTTANQIPRPIFAAALTGVDRKLLIDLPEDVAKPAWPRHVAKNLPYGLPGFGRVTGFVINYTPDQAVRFNLDGNPVEKLDKAYIRGSTAMRGINGSAVGVDG